MADLGCQSMVVATHNQGKLREFRSLLQPAGWEIVGLRDIAVTADYEETGSSFAENARRKAVFYSGCTDLPVMADDSGLEVFSLEGRPGIYSARYAGPGVSDAERILKLLEELRSATGDRTARFFCALALARRGSLLLEAEGECRGVIAAEPRGAHGFGYDPIFFFPELGRTYAELSETEKNCCSHRARAVAALLEMLARDRRGRGLIERSG